MRKLTGLLLVAGALSAAGASPAAAKLQIGISEQNPNMFANRWFKPLGFRYGRIVVPWNILQRHDYWPGYLKAWLAGAKRTGVEPMVAFNIQEIKPRYFGKGPTVGQYAKLIRGFRRKYPSVRTYTPWNEENHVFQPTAKSPKLAFEYYRTLRRICPACKILAGDVLDDANLTSWLGRFQRYYHGTGTWGLHNYQDANHHRALRDSWTYRMTKLVRGKIWSTEAGGVVGFKTVKGRIAYRYSPARALKAQQWLFHLLGASRVAKRYERVYVYNFYGSWDARGHRDNRWDSGLIGRGARGRPRPAYYDLKRRMKASSPAARSAGR